MTRAANANNEANLVDFAQSATEHKVKHHCQRLRNADKRLSTTDAKKAYKARSLMRTCHANSTMSINIDLPQELGDLVMKAIEIAAENCPTDTSGNKTTRQLLSLRDRLIA